MPRAQRKHKNIEHSNTSYIRSFFEHNFNENIHCSLLFHIEPFNPGENTKNAKHESTDVKILDSSSDDENDVLLKFLTLDEQRKKPDHDMQLDEIESGNEKEVPKTKKK